MSIDLNELRERDIRKKRHKPCLGELEELGRMHRQVARFFVGKVKLKRG